MAQRRGSRSRTTARDYPRTARVNQLLREIIGDTLVVIDDDRLPMVAITDVQVDTELRQAVVYFDNLDGAEADAIVLEAFDDLRGRLKVAIGKEARIRRVPELVFRPDPGVRAGEQIDEVLRTMPAVPEREHDLSAYDFGDDDTDDTDDGADGDEDEAASDDRPTP